MYFVGKWVTGDIVKLRIDNYNAIQHYVDIVLSMSQREYDSIVRMAKLDGFSPEYYMHNRINIVGIEIEEEGRAQQG